MKQRQSETAGTGGTPTPAAKGTSRRDFLRTTGAAAAIGMSGLSLARGAHAAGEDPVLKIALIGCGGRGTGAAANAMDADPRTRLTAMADAFEDRLNSSLAALKEKYADRVDVTPDTKFVGLDAYVKAIQSDVDVVLLCEPPHFRPIHLRAAVDAGKHIFCEKPVAVDAPGYRSVLESTEIAKQKGLSLVSGLCWRYHNATRETVQRIQDGAIGDIVTIQETYNTGHIGGRPRDPALTEMEFQVRNWYCFTWLSGDHNVEQHIHSLDKALWVMHDEPPGDWEAGKFVRRCRSSATSTITTPSATNTRTVSASILSAVSTPTAGTTPPTTSSAPRGWASS